MNLDLPKLVLTVWSLIPHLKYVVLGASILLTVAVGVALRRKLTTLERACTWALAVVALLAFLDYTKVHWQTRNYFNNYEFYHYYLGTKYSKELGYTRLYGAAVVAQKEAGRSKLPSEVRDLATSRRVSVDKILKKAKSYKRHFSESRWQDFVEDVRFFRSRVGLPVWSRMVTDKGYNASPVWTMVSGTLANLIPTSNPVGMHALAALDAVLLVGAFAMVAWAFGLRTMLLVFILFAAHFVTSMFVMKSAFLRLEWVACLLAALSLLKKGYVKSAAALTAYAAMVRIFPVLFACGIGFKFVHTLVTRRKVERAHAQYVIVFGATAVLLFVASAIYAGGFSYWRDFLIKILTHDFAIAAWRVGFKYVFLMGYDGTAVGGGTLSAFFREWYWLYGLIVLMFVALFYLLVQQLEDWEAQAMSFVLVYFLVAPTYYYYVVLVVPCLWFAAKLEDPRRAAGLVYMFAAAMLSHWFFALWDRTYALFFAISCLVLAQVLYMIVLASRPRALATTAAHGRA